jgi:cell pole-organizing protein PopZ
MRQTQKLKDILESSLRGLDASYKASQDERRQSLEDRRFCSIAGAQWEGKLGEQFENKPKFEFNKVHLSIIRIYNEYRNNPVTVDFVAKDGTESGRLADTCDSLYRADEQDSCADEAYDNAFEEAVAGGFGAYRVTEEYEDEGDPDNDDQRIRFRPIFDADQTVFFSADAKRQDKSDSPECWVLCGMSPEFYKEKYGRDISSIEMAFDDLEFDWVTPDVVYVAEYFKEEDVGETVHYFESFDGEKKRLNESEFTDEDGEYDQDAFEEKKQELELAGWTFEKTRKIKVKRIHKYIHDGAGILEDCGHIAGKLIPIIPVFGKRWFVNGIERFMGHVRMAKDPQRLKNMQISKLAEIAALGSVEKPIFLPEQMTGHAHLWADDNVKQYPYLLVNPITDAMGQKVPGGPVGYTKAPEIPPAMAALLGGTESDLTDILGNAQAGEKLEPNQSGKAVELIQSRLDMQSFIYTSNNAKGRKRGGEVWLSKASELYSRKGRKMRGLTRQNRPEALELQRPILVGGKTELENDLTQAKFEVATDVGPASSSKKSATVRALTNVAMLAEDPQDKKVIVGTIMQNLEGEGLTELAEYYRLQMVRMGVVKPTDEEKTAMEAEAQNAKPDPNAAYLSAAAEKESALAARAQADTLKIVEQTSQVKAETIKTLSEVGASEQRQALEAMSALQPQEQPQPLEQIVSPDAVA